MAEVKKQKSVIRASGRTRYTFNHDTSGFPAAVCLVRSGSIAGDESQIAFTCRASTAASTNRVARYVTATASQNGLAAKADEAAEYSK